jgi:hypothetical protein
LLVEAVADVDEQRSEVVLILHWQGGQHSELRIPKNKSGRRIMDVAADATEVLESLADDSLTRLSPQRSTAYAFAQEATTHGPRVG